jgi:hypothetical protein
VVFDINHVFQKLFCSIGSVVGHEANYQVALQHQLSLSTADDVLREHIDVRTGRGGIDVVVRKSESLQLVMAFEIKGGAHGDRNALHDTFGPDGFCSDFDRLVKLKSSDTKCWMVAIDALELGRGLSYRSMKGAIELAQERGIGFAYYALGEDRATVVDPEGTLHQLDISGFQKPGTAYSDLEPLIIDSCYLSRALDLSGRFYEKEADIVGRLYSQLRKAKCASSQVSLETYFGFAPNAGMHERPDLCLYEPPIEGRFNLYPQGNTSLSNDKIKLESLRCMIEVKGSLTLRKSWDKTLLKKYMADIDKMKNWRNRIESVKREYQLKGQQVEYVFVAVDHREERLSEALLNELLEAARGSGVLCQYIHNPCLN